MTNFKGQEWFEIPHRSYGATTAIYQVGQVITDPFDFDSALFRNGPFNGKPIRELSETIQHGGVLSVAYSSSTSTFDVSTAHDTVIEGARIDGKGVSVLWQVLKHERIIRNHELLEAVIQEAEVTAYLARPKGRKRLHLVTEVIKVQEIIPQYQDSGMAQSQQLQPMPGFFEAPSTCDDLHLPVGFEGQKNGKPFVWKYKLERIHHPGDLHAVFAERFSPSQAISDRQTSCVAQLSSFLFGWMWSPPRQKTIPYGSDGGETAALPARPATLKWMVEYENLTPNPLREQNPKFPPLGSSWDSRLRVPPPPRAPIPWPTFQPRAQTDDGMSFSSEHSDGHNPEEGAGPGNSSDSGARVFWVPPRRRMARRRSTEDFRSSMLMQSGNLLSYEEADELTHRSRLRKMAEKHSLSVETREGLAGNGARANGTSHAAAESKGKGRIEMPESPPRTPQTARFPAAVAPGTIMNSLARPVVDPPSAAIQGAEFDVFDSEAAELANDLSQGEKAINHGKKWFDDDEYLEKVNNFLNKLRSGRHNERPKIAVLDTGLDFDHPLLSTYLAHKQLSRENSLDFTLQPPVPVEGDKVGHGTHCTHLILMTCPTAEIYVAKVFKKRKADKSTADCIAKAIKHAVKEWEVDIVSMSFAFSEDQKLIEDAFAEVEKADKKVLFLAAASNYRNLASNPIGFPANQKNVIPVFSHTWAPERSKFSPNRCVDEKFSVLGEHLTAAFPKKLNSSAGFYEKTESGTSMATAIMAGIAGLVVEFSKLRQQRKAESDYQSSDTTSILQPDRLLTREGMMAVFRLMVPPKEKLGADGYIYLRPWVLFRSRRENDPWNVVYEINKVLGTLNRSG